MRKWANAHLFLAHALWKEIQGTILEVKGNSFFQTEDIYTWAQFRYLFQDQSLEFMLELLVI